MNVDISDLEEQMMDFTQKISLSTVNLLYFYVTVKVNKKSTFSFAEGLHCEPSLSVLLCSEHRFLSPYRNEGTESVKPGNLTVTRLLEAVCSHCTNSH